MPAATKDQIVLRPVIAWECSSTFAYTATIEATDATGNASTAQATVAVPRSHTRK